MSKNMVLADLVKKVREVAAEKPDTKYGSGRGCWYSKYGNKEEPGCLIGVAIRRLYPELFKALKQMEDCGLKTSGISYQLVQLPDGWTHDNDPKMVKWLTSVQAQQDVKISWGVCVTTTDSFLQ